MPQKRMTAAEYRRDRLIEMSEDDLARDLRQLATKRGWRAYHTHDSRRSEPGYPDWTLARRGRLIIAELKAVTGSWREGQREWLAELSGTTAETWRFRMTWTDAPAAVYSSSRLVVACWTPLDWDTITHVLT